MLLDRAHVTAASRIMLPTYPIMLGIVGLSLTHSDHDRLVATPALDYADRVLDIRLWGVAYLIIAALMVAALACRRRVIYQWALALTVAWMGLWTLLMIGSFLFDESSPSAWSWPGFITVSCYASLRSLSAREHD